MGFFQNKTGPFRRFAGNTQRRMQAAAGKPVTSSQSGIGQTLRDFPRGHRRPAF
jgi:hypothetical protein